MVRKIGTISGKSPLAPKQIRRLPNLTIYFGRKLSAFIRVKIILQIDFLDEYIVLVRGESDHHRQGVSWSEKLLQDPQKCLTFKSQHDSFIWSYQC